ncbi:hypothetical protein Tsubulata_043344, partial [Turnera subulata]
DDASKGSPSYSPPTFGKEGEAEEDHTPGQQKKSVLAKVKEKARKWRSTLSKKKHGEENNTTPSWGVSLDDEEDDEDPEYLGAPMYESELAPQGYKQNPRSTPVISEKHVLPSSVSHAEKHVLPSSLGLSAGKDSVADKRPVAETAAAEARGKEVKKLNAAEDRGKEVSAAAATRGGKEVKEVKVITPEEAQGEEVPSGIVSQTVNETLMPAIATISDATHSLASKIQDLTVSTVEAISSASTPSTGRSQPVPGSLEAKQATLPPVALSQGESAGTNSDQPSTREQIWDKGVSVKEYILHKFEPGEDEKALSEVISEAISPKQSLGERSVVDKMKQAVNSLLSKEEPPQKVVFHSAHSSYSHIPISINAHEGKSLHSLSVIEEENHGRILQTN